MRCFENQKHLATSHGHRNTSSLNILGVIVLCRRRGLYIAQDQYPRHSMHVNFPSSLPLLQYHQFCSLVHSWRWDMMRLEDEAPTERKGVREEGNPPGDRRKE